MTRIVIEKGVPMPESRGRRKQDEYDAALSKMEIGDSFVAEGTTLNKTLGRLRGACRRTGAHISTRTLEHSEVPNALEGMIYLRVWRIEPKKVRTLP